MADRIPEHVVDDDSSTPGRHRPRRSRRPSIHTPVASDMLTRSLHAAAFDVTGISGQAIPSTKVPLLARDGNPVDYAIVDADDEPWVRQWIWRRSSGGYAVRSETSGGKKRTIYLHRLIAAPPEGVVVDHVNGIKLDNRRSNLRWASASQNNANAIDRRRRGSFRGVYWHKPSQKWVAQISVNGTLRHLGVFESDSAAAAAYNGAAQYAFGPYARLNPV